MCKQTNLLKLSDYCSYLLFSTLNVLHYLEPATLSCRCLQLGCYRISDAHFINA